MKGTAGMSKHKDLWLASGALLAVVAVVALVIGYAGMRELQYANHGLDGKRVDDLRAIAVAIGKCGAKLPATLADLPPDLVVNLKDPVTKASYEYRPTSSTTFELCATFAIASAEDHFAASPRPTHWDHPQGRHCYQLDTHDVNVP